MSPNTSMPAQVPQQGIPSRDGVTIGVVDFDVGRVDLRKQVVEVGASSHGWAVDERKVFGQEEHDVEMAGEIGPPHRPLVNAHALVHTLVAIG